MSLIANASTLASTFVNISLSSHSSAFQTPHPYHQIVQQSYSSLLRGNLYGLKDKKKVAKKNETAAASRSKQTAN